MSCYFGRADFEKRHIPINIRVPVASNKPLTGSGMEFNWIPGVGELGNTWDSVFTLLILLHKPPLTALSFCAQLIVLFGLDTTNQYCVPEDNNG